MMLAGISVKGSYHDINQDSFRIERLNKGFVVALSDGLGSKKFSQYGSRAICDCVVDTAKTLADEITSIDPKVFVEKVHANWLEKLKDFQIENCYATMLVFVIYAGSGFALRMGDGFIGFWADDEIKILFDQKDDYFANETDCVTEKLLYERLEIAEFEITELRGGVICSDGVGIGNMTENDLTSFTRDFIEGYCDMDVRAISNHINSWLSDWPGADDKTLAFFISERI